MIGRPLSSSSLVFSMASVNITFRSILASTWARNAQTGSSEQAKIKFLSTDILIIAAFATFTSLISHYWFSIESASKSWFSRRVSFYARLKALGADDSSLFLLRPISRFSPWLHQSSARILFYLFLWLPKLPKKVQYCQDHRLTRAILRLAQRIRRRLAKSSVFFIRHLYWRSCDFLLTPARCVESISIAPSKSHSSSLSTSSQNLPKFESAIVVWCLCAASDTTDIFR